MGWVSGRRKPRISTFDGSPGGEVSFLVTETVGPLHLPNASRPATTQLVRASVWEPVSAVAGWVLEQALGGPAEWDAQRAAQVLSEACGLLAVAVAAAVVEAAAARA